MNTKPVSMICQEPVSAFKAFKQIFKFFIFFFKTERKCMCACVTVCVLCMCVSACLHIAKPIGRGDAMGVYPASGW